MKGMALVLAALAVSCGDTDSKSSKTGEVFVFQARARLNLALGTPMPPAEDSAHHRDTARPSRDSVPQSTGDVRSGIS